VVRRSAERDAEGLSGGDGGVPENYVTIESGGRGFAAGMNPSPYVLENGPMTIPDTTAAVLRAILIACAEQVSAENLRLFNLTSPLDLPLKGLAMMFRDDDSGLVGDAFEWSVLTAINAGDPEISRLAEQALALFNLNVLRPQAVLVAAESGRLVSYSPDLPADATLVTGRVGRPPLLAKLLSEATPKNWKADLVLGGGGTRWVLASVKSNPRDLRPSLKAASTLPHPPKIGITPTAGRGEVTVDNRLDAVIMRIPVDAHLMELSKVVLAAVRDAFGRHLNLTGGSPLHHSHTKIAAQLYEWRKLNLRIVLDLLLEATHSRGRADKVQLLTGEPLEAGADAPATGAALVAVNALRPRQGRNTIGYPATYPVTRHEVGFKVMPAG
jgi:hypothetical protein